MLIGTCRKDLRHGAHSLLHRLPRVDTETWAPGIILETSKATFIDEFLANSTATARGEIDPEALILMDQASLRCRLKSLCHDAGCPTKARETCENSGSRRRNWRSAALQELPLATQRATARPQTALRSHG